MTDKRVDWCWLSCTTYWFWVIVRCQHGWKHDLSCHYDQATWCCPMGGSGTSCGRYSSHFTDILQWHIFLWKCHASSRLAFDRRRFILTVRMQTLSGQLPWSEIKNSTIIIIKLYEKCLPQRPESLPMSDADWDFIMLCMSLVAELRPSVVEVLEWVNKVISSREFPCLTLRATSRWSHSRLWNYRS